MSGKMTIELPPTAPQAPVSRLHELTFFEVKSSRKAVIDRCGYLVGGPDRKGMNALNETKLWQLWQRDVQEAGERAPEAVRTFFEHTKRLATPPKETMDVKVYGSNPSSLQEKLIFSEEITDFGGENVGTVDSNFCAVQLDLGMGLDLGAGLGTGLGTVTASPATPAFPVCEGKLANPPRFATSFSGMEEFLQCPRKWAASKYYKVVKFEETEAIRWGNRVHLTAENYLRNALDGGSRPVETECLPLVKRYCDFFLSMGGEIHVEKEICCTKDRKPCGWKDWNTVWFRFKGDVFVIKDRRLIYVDWKSGRLKTDFFQIEVAVALADLFFGDLFDTADGKLIFVKESDPKKAVVGLPKPIQKADIPEIWSRIHAITNRMMEAWETANFRMQTNGLCRNYCDDLSCVHNGRR